MRGGCKQPAFTKTRSLERSRATVVRIVPLGKGAARLTLSQFVGNIAASIDPCDEFFGGARMWHHSSIADSRPGQLSSGAAES